MVFRYLRACVLNGFVSMTIQSAKEGAMPEQNLHERWQHVRERSVALAKPLSAEDCSAQSMPDASPIKWHLAHTSWFFETFILETLEPGFTPFHPAFRMLFNSYYNGIGEKHPRPQRGLLTRPSLDEVLAYRKNVDERISRLWRNSNSPELTGLLELGLQHEQQHQELMLTDIKHLLWCNPLAPVMLPTPFPHSSELAAVPFAEPAPVAQLRWQKFEPGLLEIGHRGNGFCFDNETPRHRQFVEAFELASRLVNNGEYLAFIEAGGYQNPALWLAEGWDWRQAQDLHHPIYWQLHEGHWRKFTLHGWQALDFQQPVGHLSYFEAAAFAHWAGARLPTEFEWECAAGAHNQVDQTGQIGPICQLDQMFDHCWQWTSSSYAAYPGFETPLGAIGEYNGKFMVNQYVLRGSSYFTPAGHARISYRNFFPASARWQMTGLRLARSVFVDKD
jgi:ergothioneine biosynthesis protein EgtB